VIVSDFAVFLASDSHPLFMQAKYYYEGLIGNYCLAERDGELVRLWLGDRFDLSPSDVELRETPLLREAHRQLGAYFDRQLRVFDLPLRAEGTVFQERVWSSLREIPYGETITYGELARRTGNENACRAVGMANGRNPLPIFIPCHRVVGAGGRLTGYTGGLDVKVKLLMVEQICLY